MTSNDRTGRAARREERRRAIRRRRLIAAACLAGAVVAIPVLAGAYGGGDAPAAKTVLRSGDAKERPKTAKRRLAVGAKRANRSAQARPALRVSKRPSDRARLKLVGVISGNISPKSVASSGAGYVTAQNMMYRHSVTVYDAATLKLVKTIPDSVNLAKLGYREYGTVKGAPVEAAFTSNGRYGFVSNYSMYGAGFGPEGSDNCTPSSGTSRSFVYRIDMRTLAIDRPIASAPCRRWLQSPLTIASSSSATGAPGI